MNPNQVLSLRVNNRLLRENADVLRILDRLLEDQIINSVRSCEILLTISSNLIFEQCFFFNVSSINSRKQNLRNFCQFIGERKKYLLRCVIALSYTPKVI